MKQQDYYLKKGSKIDDKNEDGYNILEYLLNKPRFNLKKLLFILNRKKDASLITYQILLSLVKYGYMDLLEKILQYKFFDSKFILKLILIHKNKISFSNDTFKLFLYENNNGIIRINENTSGSVITLLQRNAFLNIDLPQNY